MSIINSTSNHVYPVSSTESTGKDNNDWMLRKTQRKQSMLEHEKYEREMAKEQKDVEQLFEHQETSHNESIHQNAWEHMLMNEIGGNNEVTEIINKEAIVELEQNVLRSFSSRYLSEDEIKILFEFCDDIGFSEKTQKLGDELLDCDEGTESDMLNKFFAKEQLNTAQSYMVLCYIMAQLHAKKRKKLFEKQLSEWLQRFEEQESAYLFEFFNIQNNTQISKQIKQHDLGQLAQLASTKQQTATLRQIIQLIADTFNNKFDSMVSLYMKLKVRQLTQLTQLKLNVEEKAQLFDLINLEKLLMIINSVYIKQNAFYNQLIQAKLAVEGVVGSDTSQALITTTILCEASFVSELTIDKLIRQWQLNELQGQSYLRFLAEIIIFLQTLPLELFNHNPVNLQKIVSGIRSLLVDKSQNAAPLASTNTGLDILKPKSRLIKYV